MTCTDLSIILPTYNEAGHIISLLQDIVRVCHPREIIVVDDRSPDGTAAVVRSLQQAGTHSSVVDHLPPPGLTLSLQTGITAASGEIIAWMDADYSHPPDLLPSLYAAIQYADIAVASALCPSGKDERSDRRAVFFSFLINRACQVFFGKTVHHYTSGYILAKKSVLSDIPLRGDYGEYCIDFLVRAQRQGRRIVEVPYTCTDRRTGYSKTATSTGGFLWRGRTYVATIVRLLLMPGTKGQFNRKR